MFFNIVFMLNVTAGASAVTFTPEFKVDASTDNHEMVAGEPSRWELKFKNNETNQYHHHYMIMHGKPLHMIVVRDDLETFAHVHPNFSHHSRAFTITANSESVPDPDNVDLPTAVPTEGRYLVFTETMPHVDEDPEMLMLYNRFEITSRARTSLQKRLLPYFFSAPKFAMTTATSSYEHQQTKYFDDSGKTAEPGARYRVGLFYEQLRWCTWYLPKFYAQVDVWDEVAQKYKPATNLQEWLTMGGHAVLISRAAPTEQNSFYHLHAFLPVINEGEFVLPYDDHFNPMRDGDYRMFIQFKENHIVRTVDFDFVYVNPPPPQDFIATDSTCLSR